MRWRTALFLALVLVPARLGLGQAEVVENGRAGALPAGRVSAARMMNGPEIRAKLGLTREYEGGAGLSSVKVAVLDSGFEGVGGGRAYLPADAVIVEHYDPELIRRFNLGDPEFRKGFEPGNRHGRVMAQIVWGVTGARPEGPRFYLLNANGPTMLRRAVRYAIESKVDLILFSGSFEGGGNGDGRGPINRVVDDALAAGIPWINAAGNYGGRVFNGPIRPLDDGYLRLRKGADVASLRFRNHVDENNVNVTLTWNDYREDEDAGTEKDLDLFVEDWAGRRVGSGEKVQVTGVPQADSEQSRNPRERVVLESLPAIPYFPKDPDYCYRIRIRAKGGRFTSEDRLRVLVTASREAYTPPDGGPPRSAFEFVDASDQGELYPPADNLLALTVGDGSPSSSMGPTVDGRTKPDVLLEDSRAYFSDGEVSSGSSNAAAYVAGAVAILKAAAPDLGPGPLLRIARQGPPLPASILADRPRAVNATSSVLRLWQAPTRAKLVEVMRAPR
ncbi:S8 family serine peptidase [Isosphaeraceae bacterium EP7]